MKVVLVEDDPGVTGFLVKGLVAEGHEVVAIADGEAAVATDQEAYVGADVVLLDLTLPGRDGIEVLSHVRTHHPQVAVIVLTARHRVADKVQLFDAGADDYVTKPFAFEELLARMRAAVRQSTRGEVTRKAAGELSLDLLAKTAHRNDRRLELSPREWALLEFLFEHRGEVLTRDGILTAVWGIDFGTSSNVVDVYIGYLRKKLDHHGERMMLETVRGRGYRLNP